MPLNTPAFSHPNLGCDPEFFFTRKGKVIGSELVIPEKGMPLSTITSSKIIRDGVQGELNPTPNGCRDILASNLVGMFHHIDKELIKKDKEQTLNISFNQLEKVSKPNFNKLSAKSKEFGCSPSLSLYGEQINIAGINPEEYRYRAAGGHVHLGHVGKSNNPDLYRALTTDAERTVALLDIICGNTLVLVDRSRGNIERRKVYGRAGEYRLPKHGLEYRTPSNFWLHCKPLLSLTFGLARLAVDLIADKKHNELYYKAFTEAVNMEDIKTAINTNNFRLAMKNFKKIEKLLLEVAGESTIGSVPINRHNIKQFYFFIEKVHKQGISYWFPNPPMYHWTVNNNNSNQSGSNYYKGFNDFLISDVTPKMKKK